MSSFMWAFRMVTMAVRMVLGQNHFLRSFRAACSDELADEASDEALGIFGVLDGTANGLADEPLGK
jgi:hypothetical protein